jgi:hypothetical protein
MPDLEVIEKKRITVCSCEKGSRNGLQCAVVKKADETDYSVQFSKRQTKRITVCSCEKGFRESKHRYSVATLTRWHCAASGSGIHRDESR